MYAENQEQDMVIGTGRIGRGGEVVFPENILELAGLHEGDSIEVSAEGPCIVVRPAKPKRRGFEAWIGAFPVDPSEGDAVERQREMRGWDEWDRKEFPR